jgi:hypothetical protein
VQRRQRSPHLIDPAPAEEQKAERDVARPNREQKFMTTDE